MSAGVERSFEPDAHHAFDEILAEEVGGKAEDVGVIVPAAHFGSDGIVAGSGSDAVHFVGGNAHADAGATNENPAVHRAGADRLGGLKGDVGKIGRASCR